MGARRPAAEAARDDVRHVGLVDRPGVHLEPLPAVCAGQAVLPHDAADAAPADGNARPPGRRLDLARSVPALLAACAAAAAVAPDIKVLKGRVVSGDQFVSPAEQKERILATFGDLCCEMEGCTIAQAAYLNGVPLVVVRAISDKPCAEGRVVTTTLSRRRPPATAPASPRAWLSFRPCAPGPFFMLGPRRAGPFPKRSAERKC